MASTKAPLGAESRPVPEAIESDRISALERRVRDLEGGRGPARPWLAWTRSDLRWWASTPPLLLILLAGVGRASDATGLPIGLLVFALWAAAAVLWAVVEVFAGGDLRFGVGRLVLIVAALGAALGYWRAVAYGPYQAEQRCLAEIRGIKGTVHRDPMGPAWLMGTIGDGYFRRVVQHELAGHEADARQVTRLRGLPHLNGLFLTGAQFDDGIIDDLASLTALESVYLNDSRVTAAGIARFQRARPGVEIVRQGQVIDDPSRIPFQ